MSSDSASPEAFCVQNASTRISICWDWNKSTQLHNELINLLETLGSADLDMVEQVGQQHVVLSTQELISVLVDKN